MADESGAARLSYNANVIFALCSWPCSLKFLWAPIVDARFFRSVGRRKSWIVPAQSMAGILMVMGANFVERQLGLGFGHTLGETVNVKDVTVFFLVLYALMATQDIAVDGWDFEKDSWPWDCVKLDWSKHWFLFRFAGFLALNDAETSEHH
jgi:MFS transporter, PAT family, solute carrier family 33 (acetyl-CoA transportor), member 1